MSGCSALSKQDLVCPITLDIYRDPVLASDGHVYERKAILTWIAQQGTSPLTREPLNVNDLHTDERIRQLCESYRLTHQINSCQTSVISLPESLASQTNIDNYQESSSSSTTKLCYPKRLLIIFIVITCIICPIIIVTSIILCVHRSDSICSRKCAIDLIHKRLLQTNYFRIFNDN